MTDYDFIPINKLHKLAKDLNGKTFTYLKVIKLLGINKKSKCLLWQCVCRCGNIKNVLSVNLLSGNTKSCGCFHKETVSKMFKGKKPKTTLPKGEAAARYIYNTYKTTAIRMKREFSLTKEQFLDIIKMPCNYCGVMPYKEIQNGHRNLNGSFLANGIDRIDSKRGYSVDNVTSCCTICNIAKNSMSTDDFLAWVDRIYNFQKRLKNE